MAIFNKWRKALTATLAAVAMAAALTPLHSCHDHEEWSNDAYGNFDALWTILDEHYSFFGYKQIDWKATGERYRAKIFPGMTSQELFGLCSDMLKELKVGQRRVAILDLGKISGKLRPAAHRRALPQLRLPPHLGH